MEAQAQDAHWKWFHSRVLFSQISFSFSSYDTRTAKGIWDLLKPGNVWITGVLCYGMVMEWDRRSNSMAIGFSNRPPQVN